MRTYAQAKEFAQQQHRSGSSSWHNLCQMFSRQCVGASPFGASAREAFNATPAENRHQSSPPPPGAIAYYGFADHGAGHAVFAVHGGFVWSNDILRRRSDRPRPVGRLPGEVEAALPRLDLGPPDRRRAAGAAAARAQRRPRLPPGQARSTPARCSWRRTTRTASGTSRWRCWLAASSSRTGPTGYYGRHTRRGVAAFQRRCGWEGKDADGIAGAQTIARLGLVWVDG